MRLRRFRHAPIRPGDYARVRAPSLRGEYVENLHGVEWYDAPVPPWWHACWPQSRAVLAGGMLAERCPCGAYRDERGPWIERNTSTPRTPAEQASRERDQEADRLIDAYAAAELARDGAAMASIRSQLRELPDAGPGG